MDIKKIIDVLLIIKKNKYKAYLVGGSARDILFQKEFIDVDIATNAPLSFLKKTFDVVDESGSSMGAVKIKYKHIVMELTHFRSETYDYQSIYPKKIEFIDDERKDAKRRDFTINAIYLDLTNNQIIDNFGGVNDLFNYKLRFIGEASLRIKEDPSRILRGLRIAAKMNFEIDKETSKAFDEYKDELKRLTKSKIQKEINKMIADIGKVKTEKILARYQISQYLTFDEEGKK